MDDLTLPLPGLSPLAASKVDAAFDGGMLSSNAGVLLLREVEQPARGRRSAGGAASTIRVIRRAVDHTVAEMIGFRDADDRRRL